MPLYEFECEVCHKRDQILVSYDQLANVKLTCHKKKMIRVYDAPSVITGTSGQRDLLKKKQEQRKTRSRAHFKNEILPTIKDPTERRHFEKKFKNTRKIDHTKLK